MVVYKGYLYSTLADVPVDSNQVTCHQWLGYRSVPSGWTIAKDNLDSSAVAGAHYWSTHDLVVSNGNAYRGLYCAGCAGVFCCGGRLAQSGSTYNVPYCNCQILITSISHPFNLFLNSTLNYYIIFEFPCLRTMSSR
jgi:hypothetical protein